MALIRTSNPALNARTFADLRRDPTAPPMTLEGTVNKAALLLFLVVVPAAWVWSQVRAAGTTTRKRDRKSTRLNSSHSSISYAVFCLKKKNKSSGNAQA